MARIFASGDNLYLGVTGLPAATALVTAFVNDGTQVKKLGPASYRPDIQPEHLFNIRDGQPHLVETAPSYRVEVITVLDLGELAPSLRWKLRLGQGDVER